MNLDLDGQTIDAITLDFAVTIRTDTAAVFRVSTALVIHGPGGSIVLVKADDVGPTSSSLVEILHRTITSAEVDDDDGTLRLALEPEIVVEVRSDDDYEAWSFNAGGRKVVALPGGGLAVWDG